MDIRGIYKHFKGKYYEVIGEAVDSSIRTKYVFYKQLYAPFEFWIRPKEMFFGKKDIESDIIPRFVKFSDSSQDTLNNIDINKIRVNHSETKELYKIIGTKDGYFLISKIK